MTAIFPANSRVCAYLRDSGGPSQELSISQQLEKVGDWCKEQGIVLSRVFKDEARSGTKVAGRTQFLSMMTYLDGTVPELGIVLWELSRFSRDFTDCNFYLSDIRRRGYIVHSITDNIPPSLDGKLLESVKIWMNSKYSADLGKNVKRGQSYMISLHHSWRWRVPPGFKLEAVNTGKRRDGKERVIHRLIVDPTTAPLIIQAYEMRAMGATIREIHNKINLFTYHNSYMDMLTNRIYLGEFSHKDIFIPEYCEPIIDVKLFDNVQRLNIERARGQGIHHPRIVRSRFVLSGLLFCQVCGTKLVSSSSKNHNGRYDYYGCIGHNIKSPCGGYNISKAKIEKRVVDALRSVILDKSVLNKVYEEACNRLATANNERGYLQLRTKAQIKEVDNKISRMLSAIKDTGHSRAMLDELAVLENEKQRLEGELLSIARPKEIIPVPEFNELMAHIGDDLDHANDQQLEIILRGFIRRIELRKVYERVIRGRIEYVLPMDVDSPSLFIDM